MSEINLKNIKALIFDMDGVLVNSEPVILKAAIAGLSEFGINASPLDFVPFIGTGEDRFVGGVAEKHGFVYRVEMKRRVYEIYVKIVKDCIELFEGIPLLLKDLKQSGYRIALASSADYVKINANLDAAGIDRQLFDGVVSGEDVVNKKPAPDIFIKAAGLLGIHPSECMVVEDALSGIKAAKAAGMKVTAVKGSFPDNVLAKENPDLIVEKTIDIVNCLNIL